MIISCSIDDLIVVSPEQKIEKILNDFQVKKFEIRIFYHN